MKTTLNINMNGLSQPQILAVLQKYSRPIISRVIDGVLVVGVNSLSDSDGQKLCEDLGLEYFSIMRGSVGHLIPKLEGYYFYYKGFKKLDYEGSKKQ